MFDLGTVIASFRLFLLFTAAGAMLGISSAASARNVATTHLDRCGSDTCLVVTGHRSDKTAPVLLAGHVVAVEGDRHWHVALPLDTVRAWSTPAARTIAVKVDRNSGDGVAMLPIGLLGERVELAFMDVQAR